MTEKLLSPMRTRPWPERWLTRVLGAALSCAVRVGQRMDQGDIAVLFADSGWKYLSTQLWTKTVEEASDALNDQLLW